MSSTNFENLIEKFPDISDSIEKIEAESRVEQSKLTPEYTMERFFEKFSLPFSSTSAMLLSALEELGILSKVVRVESSKGGGIGDYDSIVDVPEEVHDFRIDENVKVRPEDLKVLYKLLKS